MTKTAQIKFYSKQKQAAQISARRTKNIGILSTCAGTATIIAACANTLMNPPMPTTNELTVGTLGGAGVLLGIMFLRLSKQYTQDIKKYKKQIRKIKKQR